MPVVRVQRLAKLEAIRGFAAFYVFLNHFRPFHGRSLEVPFSFGPEAVILFFLLSGFVIYYATISAGKSTTFRYYFIRRFRRIYPLFLVAMLLGFLQLALAAKTFRVVTFSNFVGNLAMLQDVSTLKRGVWVDTFAGNWPLWSLSYEWWFYMMFWPIAMMGWIGRRARRYVVFGLSLAGSVLYQLAPNQICLFVGYFFIWWCGVELAVEFVAAGRLTWKRQLPSIILLSVLGAIWSIPVVIAIMKNSPLQFGYAPVLQLRHFAAGVVLLILGLLWYDAKFRGFWLFMAFAPLAPISYSFYIFHGLVVRAGYFAGLGNPFLQLLCQFALLVPICWICEVKLQRAFNKIVDAIIPPGISCSRSAASIKSPSAASQVSREQVTLD